LIALALAVVLHTVCSSSCCREATTDEVLCGNVVEERRINVAFIIGSEFGVLFLSYHT